MAECGSVCLDKGGEIMTSMGVNGTSLIGTMVCGQELCFVSFFSLQQAVNSCPTPQSATVAFVCVERVRGAWHVSCGMLQ